MDEIFIEHPFRQFVYMYMRNYAAVAGLAIFVTIIGAALLAPIVLDVDPFEMVDAPLLPPGESGHISVPTILAATCSSPSSTAPG